MGHPGVSLASSGSMYYLRRTISGCPRVVRRHFSHSDNTNAAPNTSTHSALLDKEASPATELGSLQKQFSIVTESLLKKPEFVKQVESQEDLDIDEYGANRLTGEINGPKGREPTRFGDWERKGRVSDF